MTGFDETVPPDDATDPSRAAGAVPDVEQQPDTEPPGGADPNEMDELAPEHDGKNPALEDDDD